MRNLIGISGKIGSGKDTVGKIIQYLASVENPTSIEFIKRHINRNEEIKDVQVNYTKDGIIYHKYQIKKYAFKLKQIASLMLSIPVEDFEKQEVKDRVLGEEWIRYGYANGFIQKEGKTIMNNESCSKERYEDELRTNWQTAYKSEMTVRMFLQLLGTEAMRNVIHTNAWVNALFADYKGEVVGYDGSKRKDILSTNLPNWIITDVRFPNEKQAIEERNGIVIRVDDSKRLIGNFHDALGIITKGAWRAANSGFEHPSETALDDATFDYTIENNGTIEELIEKVKQILIKEQII